MLGTRISACSATLNRSGCQDFDILLSGHFVSEKLPKIAATYDCWLFFRDFTGMYGHVLMNIILCSVFGKLGTVFGKVFKIIIFN